MVGITHNTDALLLLILLGSRIYNRAYRRPKISNKRSLEKKCNHFPSKLIDWSLRNPAMNYEPWPSTKPQEKLRGNHTVGF